MPTKAVAGAGGVGGGMTLGGALAILLIKLWWRDADAETAVALTTLCQFLVALPSTFFAVYLTPHTG